MFESAGALITFRTPLGKSKEPIWTFISPQGETFYSHSEDTSEESAKYCVNQLLSFEGF